VSPFRPAAANDSHDITLSNVEIAVNDSDIAINDLNIAVSDPGIAVNSLNDRAAMDSGPERYTSLLRKLVRHGCRNLDVQVNYLNVQVNYLNVRVNYLNVRVNYIDVEVYIPKRIPPYKNSELSDVSDSF